MDELLQPSDCCPACCIDPGQGPEKPTSVTQVSEHGIRAEYRCSKCGHEWWTCWDARWVGWSQDAA